MKLNFYKLVLIAFLSAAFTTNSHAENTLKTYAGAYFEVSHPQDFVAVEINQNEAAFTSPDGMVEFFVYSPLWSGKPENYLEIYQDEELVNRTSKKTIKDNVYQDHIQIEWVTIKANDSSYTRSYMHRRSCHSDGFVDCLSLVFGIKYKDQKAYDQYRDTYIKFKNSLTQSAD